jgi:2-polyprenyl-3-methyl-5-hydroxy-6-metoxy-1,4-benzoquinol methylase
MTRRRLFLPESVCCYWRDSRIWDRWSVEKAGMPRSEVHIGQRELTVDEIRLLPLNSLRVLDLCCGTGRVTFDLVSLENVAEVVAVDISSKALDILRGRIKYHPKGEKLSIIETDVMSEEEMKKLGAFDVVVCLDALHHLSNPKRALKTIAQDLLLPNGLLIGNSLAKESAIHHVSAKHGRVRAYFLFARSRFFRAAHVLHPLWEYSGRQGFVRLYPFSWEELSQELSDRFRITKQKNGDYHWFVARRADAIYRPEHQ